MKKVGLYLGIIVLLFTAIFVININNKDKIKSKTANQSSPSKEFVADKNYNIDEDLDVPKVIFVYSDPTEHHPQG